MKNELPKPKPDPSRTKDDGDPLQPKITKSVIEWWESPVGASVMKVLFEKQSRIFDATNPVQNK